jgi:hypothetical protein
MTSSEYEGLPSDISNIVFSQPPSPPKSYQLYYPDNDSNIIDIFEIFLTIMIEGINVRCGGTITKEIFDTFDENIIMSLQPWLNSLGYRVNVSVIPRENVPEYETFYCQIALNVDPVWKLYFEMRNFSKNYQFIFGDKSPYHLDQLCSLQNLYTILIRKNITYKISFDYI